VSRETEVSNSHVEVKSVPFVKTVGRRQFSAVEKLRIVQAASNCAHGELGALLRKEGVYSSQLTKWRHQLGLVGSAGMLGVKRGRKPRYDPKDLRIAELEKKNKQLEAKLDVANYLVELQKKVQKILGTEPTNSEEK
jgi:transposase